MRGLQETIDGLNSGSSLVEARESGREEERRRNVDNLQTLSDEYDALLKRKQKKINTLRTTLRSANDRKRRLERSKDWDRLEMRKEVSKSKSVADREGGKDQVLEFARRKFREGAGGEERARGRYHVRRKITK